MTQVCDEIFFFFFWPSGSLLLPIIWEHSLGLLLSVVSLRREKEINIFHNFSTVQLLGVERIMLRHRILASGPGRGVPQLVRFASKYTNPGREAIPGRFPTLYNPKRSASNPKIQLPAGLVYNPAPSAPSPYDTPAVFVPRGDQRTVLHNKEPFPIQYIPAINEPAERKYHLTEQDLIEIHKLRTTEPEKWTRKSLAEKFNCSPFMISVASEPNAEYKAEMERRLDVIKGMWSPRRARARNDRQRRKKLWVRDA
jgi:hypothetical protein